MVKSRRQQPNVFGQTVFAEQELQDTESGYEHLSSVPNSSELIQHLKAFNDINVEEFKLEQIVQIADTLKNGEM